MIYAFAPNRHFFWVQNPHYHISAKYMMATISAPFYFSPCSSSGRNTTCNTRKHWLRQWWCCNCCNIKDKPTAHVCHTATWRKGGIVQRVQHSH